LNSIYFTPFTISVASQSVQIRVNQNDVILTQDVQKLAERFTT
jgi:hypothetical protein